MNDNMKKPVANPFGGGANNEKPAQTRPFPLAGSMKPAAEPAAPLLPPALPPLPAQRAAYVAARERPRAPVEYVAPEEQEEQDFYDEDDDDDEDIEPISDEDNSRLKKIFLSNSNTSAPQTLYALAVDEDWQVRDAVARNESAPESILSSLAVDVNDMVRQSVLENPSISISLFASFVNDPDSEVVIAFLNNERATVDMLRPLFNHEDDEVVEMLRDSPLLSNSDKMNLRR